jgi:SAM-dependent methyltransferase
VAKIANEIGCKTGSNIIFEKDNEQQKRAFGFSMNNQKVAQEFGVEWKGRNGQLVEELIANMKHVSNSDTYLRPATDGVQCRVCKREENMAVLYDFGRQPNANHYLSCPDRELPDYPLRLDLCKNCYHTQLSYTIPPEEVFSNYIYLSGTSNTMREFFRDFADKSIQESNVAGPGTVLEIACNDGSLLDWYKERGWRTFGYDPAQNIHAISSAKGHDVTVGFWGQDPVPEYPPLDIIVAQNVCAHVPDPVLFLEKCREVMTPQTILYVQTSQSEMIEKGQYDTAYHEHLSFFTVRSMDIAAKIAGLCLDGVEKTPVHGSSYIFRFRLQSQTDITQNEIYKYEKEIGLYDDLQYYVYVEKVNELSNWLKTWQQKLVEMGVKLVGYGAAAKGMTVLNSLRWNMPLGYIADDSKMKLGYYATNRKYRIVAPNKLSESVEPLAVYVLAWNFIDEIKARVKTIRAGAPTYFIVTYPLKKVWFSDKDGKEYVVYEEIDTRFNNTSVHHPNILISHFYNEEALLTQWIRHHAPLFNCAVLIDYNSTDKSRDIIRREAPDSWNLVYSHNREFGALAIDQEVSGYENSFDNNHWRLALTTTEFLFATGLRRKENAIFDNMGTARAIRIPSLTSVDREDSPKNNLSTSLLQQKNLVYFQNGSSGILTEEEEHYVNNHYNRFMHCVRDFHNPYLIGRHDFRHASVQRNMHIIKYVYGPFPDFFSRKLQIKTRIPESDKQYNFGHQHMIEFDQLDGDYTRKQMLPLINITDELSQREYFDKYMREVAAGDQLLSGIFLNLYE